MNTFIAFLRAINVGGHTVKMDVLRDAFEALDFANVATFIASGNVIFDAAGRNTGRIERAIERHLKDTLGYDVDTFLRSPADVDAITRHDPFPRADLDADGATLYVGFLRSAPPAAAVRTLAALRSEIDDLHVHEREVYWLCRGRMSESVLSGARMEKALGMSMTLRNITTVRRLAAKYPPAP